MLFTTDHDDARNTLNAALAPGRAGEAGAGDELEPLEAVEEGRGQERLGDQRVVAAREERTTTSGVMPSASPS